MEIYLLTDYVRNTCFGEDDMLFLTYVALRKIYTKDDPIKIVSITQIIDEMFGGIKVTRWIKNSIRDNIYFLNDNLKILIVEEIGKQNNKWRIDLSGLYFDTNEYKFTKVKFSEVKRILTSSYDIKKSISLLRYYCVIVSTIPRDRGYNNMAMTTIRKYIGISESTQIRYNKILEEMNLIYFKHMNAYKKDGTGKLKTISNYYSLPEFREDMYKKANDILRQEKNMGIIMAKSDANTMRSIRQKINKNVALTSEEAMSIIKSNRHCNIMIDKVNNNKSKQKYINDIIHIDFYNEKVFKIEELEKLFNTVKDDMQEAAEEYMKYDSYEGLREIVESVLGKDELASKLTVKDIDKQIILYNKILDARNQKLGILKCHT